MKEGTFLPWTNTDSTVYFITGFYRQDGVKLTHKYAASTEKVKCFSVNPDLEKLMAGMLIPKSMMKCSPYN